MITILLSSKKKKVRLMVLEPSAQRFDNWGDSITTEQFFAQFKNSFFFLAKESV